MASFEVLVEEKLREAILEQITDIRNRLETTPTNRGGIGGIEYLQGAIFAYRNLEEIIHNVKEDVDKYLRG